MASSPGSQTLPPQSPPPHCISFLQPHPRSRPAQVWGKLLCLCPWGWGGVGVASQGGGVGGGGVGVVDGLGVGVGTVQAEELR